MNSCAQNICDCDCLHFKVNTEVILYPKALKTKNKTYKTKLKYSQNKIESCSKIKIIDGVNMENSMVSSNYIGKLNDCSEINDIENRLKQTINSISRVGSFPSVEWKYKNQKQTKFQQNQIFEKPVSQETKHNNQKFISLNDSRQTTNYYHQNHQKQNFIHFRNIQSKSKNQLNQNFCVSKNRINTQLQSTKKLAIKVSPSCSNFNSLNHTIINPTNRSSRSNLMSPKEDITIRLLQRENQQLKSQLHRLQLQQKDLLNEQIKKKQKNARQYNSLKRKSEDLKNRSNERKQELQQLQRLLYMVKRNKQQEIKKNGTIIKLKKHS